MNNLRGLYRMHLNSPVFLYLKRNAGHSKWQNIRHIKAAKDADKSILTLVMLREMRRAVLASGGIADPSKNMQLQTAVNAAIKANVKADTIKTFLARLESSAETEELYRLRGPNECILLLSFTCNPSTRPYVRENVKRILRKQSSLYLTDGFQDCFEKKGIISAKHSSGTMDTAEEAAIIAGAEEVLAEEEEGTFKFVTDSGSLWKVVKSLRESDWEILVSFVDDVPTKLVELSESELDGVLDALKQFQDHPHFFKVVHNIVE